MRVFRLLCAVTQAPFASHRSLAGLRSLAATRQATDAVNEAYYAGAGRAALEVTEGLEQDRRQTNACRFERETLPLKLDRLDEAETWLRRNVALECFQEGLRRQPDKPSLHRDFAETCLRPGAPARQSLNRTRLDVNEGQCIRAESQQVSEEAVNRAGMYSVSTAALVRSLSGCAPCESGDSEKSERHFERAVQLDPSGRWGRTARTRAAGIGR